MNFYFGQISKFKKGVTPRKKRNQKIIYDKNPKS